MWREKLVGVTWRLSDCEELVGGYIQGMMGLVLVDIDINL